MESARPILGFRGGARNILARPFPKNRLGFGQTGKRGMSAGEGSRANSGPVFSLARYFPRKIRRVFPAENMKYDNMFVR
jgi:hypothetical protein